jgi:hypothetical protein
MVEVSTKAVTQEASQMKNCYRVTERVFALVARFTGVAGVEVVSRILCSDARRMLKLNPEIPKNMTFGTRAKAG